MILQGKEGLEHSILPQGDEAYIVSKHCLSEVQRMCSTGLSCALLLLFVLIILVNYYYHYYYTIDYRVRSTEYFVP